MKLASWNINSINLRKDTVLEWIYNQKIDVLSLQEIKCETNKFPHDFFNAKGFFTEVLGQKGYNGVAVISKFPIKLIRNKLPDFSEPEIQSRYIEVEINDFILTSIYVPNGNPTNSNKFDYKIHWMNSLLKHSKSLIEFEKPVILAGDFNVIPEEIDCWDERVWVKDALALPETRRLFRSIKHLGFFDAFRLINNNKKEWSFWDYQNGSWNKDFGIRIDHFLINSFAADIIKNCEIDREPRGKERPSDHTPIICEF